MPVSALWDLPAPAKLNLFLHVTGRRADGYHLLQSIFVLIDWCDELHIERRGDGRLLRHDLGPALPADDLCLRAARLLQQQSQTAFGADIHIRKNVPWGAGMGGGSSDAATTLLALNRLWGLHWPRQRLLALALQLGADVPFFVGGHNAWVEGIGEQLSPIPVPEQWLAVVKPPTAIDTKKIFCSPLLVRDTKPAIVSGFPERDNPSNKNSVLWQGFGRNDLQAAAQAECAEVGQAADWLQAHFGNSRMTGSGSAVFARAGLLPAGEGKEKSGLSKNSGAERLPLATMPPDLPDGWAGRMCRSLVQHPLVAWAAD